MELSLSFIDNPSLAGKKLSTQNFPKMENPILVALLAVPEHPISELKLHMGAGAERGRAGTAETNSVCLMGSWR